MNIFLKTILAIFCVVVCGAATVIVNPKTDEWRIGGGGTLAVNAPNKVHLSGVMPSGDSEIGGSSPWAEIFVSGFGTNEGDVRLLIEYELSGNNTPLIRSVGFPEPGYKILIRHYYQSILGRPGDTQGLSFWASEARRLQQIGVSPQEVLRAMAYQFFGSQEYKSRNASNEQFVDVAYRTFLGREPDSGGRHFYVEQLKQGMPRSAILTTFAFSIEFDEYTRTAVGIGSTSAEALVILDAYRLLGRLPDDNGLKYWSTVFRNARCSGGVGEVERQALLMVLALVNSQEYSAKDISNAQFIGDLYTSLMRRTLDFAGLSYWLRYLETSSKQAVIAGFISSGEFQQRVRLVSAGNGC